MIVKNDMVIRFFEKIFKFKIAAITLFPFIVISSSTIVDNVLINHEKIHLKQQLEMCIIPFYIWYLIELKTKGYYDISFEKEAFRNQNNLNYLNKRKLYSFLRYF
jgi:hypothetical protein